MAPPAIAIHEFYPHRRTRALLGIDYAKAVASPMPAAPMRAVRGTIDGTASPDPIMNQLNRRSRLWTAAALWQMAAVAALCAVGPPPGLTAPAASCRSAVSAAGDVSTQPVRWVVPDGTSERTSLDDWCTGVGPAVVAADPPLPDGAAGSNELIVVTWNVHAGGGDILDLVDALRAGRLTGGRPVEHFVLLLQEAYRRGSLVPAEPRPGLRAARSIQPPRPGLLWFI